MVSSSASASTGCNRCGIGNPLGSEAMDSTHTPLISCLCLSRKRPHLLSRAIECFLAQSYPNKELVILHPRGDHATADCVRAFGSKQLQPFAIDVPGASLGELRNLSMERAAGELLCVWDDDDWHSPDRLAVQHQALRTSKKCAAILARIIIYDVVTARAHLGYERLWENSAMFVRERIETLGIRYAPLNRFEDYEFVNQLIKHNLVYPVYEPTAYIYVSSGGNTSGDTHLRTLIRHSSPLSPEQSEIVRSAVEFTESPQLAHQRMQEQRFKGSLCYVRPSAVPRT